MVASDNGGLMGFEKRRATSVHTLSNFVIVRMSQFNALNRP